MAEIDRLPTLLVYAEERVIGFVSLKQHNDCAAEIYVMGVLPEAHRQGVGRALITQAQAWLKESGVEYLQVKTLGPSHPDEGYAKTRNFYAAMGFKPLEEFTQIWDEHNPCLIMVQKASSGDKNHKKKMLPRRLRSRNWRPGGHPAFATVTVYRPSSMLPRASTMNATRISQGAMPLMAATK